MKQWDTHTNNKQLQSTEKNPNQLSCVSLSGGLRISNQPGPHSEAVVNLCNQQEAGQRQHSSAYPVSRIHKSANPEQLDETEKNPSQPSCLSPSGGLGIPNQPGSHSEAVANP